MQNPPAPSKTTDADLSPKVVALTQQFLAALPENERAEIGARVEPSIERLSLGLFRLVVMGEIKKGKSSLINALLGEPDLLPTASDIATSTVYKILYGPEPACTVFFEADPEKPDEPGRTLTIDRAQLPEYGTEDGNPNNAKCVDFIGLELPHPLLREGLVIIDTPGVGGLFRAHRDIAYRYVPLADAVFFVLDSAGREYDEFRKHIAVTLGIGLTEIYNRLNHPDHASSDFLCLRELHAAMDRAVLDAYGWSDIPTDCQFLLDYEIDEEEWGDKKKPWRYRWPDEVRDEVLARMLELNAERAKAEAGAGASAAKERGGKGTAKRAPKESKTENLFS